MKNLLKILYVIFWQRNGTCSFCVLKASFGLLSEEMNCFVWQRKFQASQYSGYGSYYSLHFATFPVLFHGIFHHKLRKRTNDCYIIYDLGTILMSMDLQCINLVFGLENVEVNLVMVSEIPFSLSWLEIRHLLKGLQNTSRCHRKVKEFSQRKQTLAALVFQFLNLVGRYQ